MTNTVTTTVQITFGAENKNCAHLSAEVDRRPEGLNKGKTSFTGGEPVYLLVYRSNNVAITGTEVSAGAVFAGESVVVDMEDTVTFAGVREARLAKPATGPLAVTWFGRSLGGLAVAEDGSTVMASKQGVPVARVRYKARARVFRLSTPLDINGDKKYDILFFVAGVAS